MDIRLIKNESELDVALERMDNLIALNPKKGKNKYEEMMLLALVIKEYEDKKYPTPTSNPIEAIKFRMDQMDLKVKDLTPFFGTTSRAYEVLNKKRQLSLNMIRKLHKGLKIPAEILINSAA